MKRHKSAYNTANTVSSIDCQTWGTAVVPKDQWINPNKRYTCGGKRVQGLTIQLHNDLGREVTYPVKGTIILSEKPFKTQYAIWSLSGKNNVVWDNPDKNLIEVKENV